MSDDILKNAHLLLVDDESALLDGLAQFLREHGTHVDTALNGREAIDALEAHPYTLVATDIRMPDVSGLELLRHIKKRDPDIEVVLFTGYASVGSALEALRLGAYDYKKNRLRCSNFFKRLSMP